jgi:hypothetical protein
MVALKTRRLTGNGLKRARSWVPSGEKMSCDTDWPAENPPSSVTQVKLYPEDSSNPTKRFPDVVTRFAESVLVPPNAILPKRSLVIVLIVVIPELVPRNIGNLLSMQIRRPERFESIAEKV